MCIVLCNYYKYIPSFSFIYKNISGCSQVTSQAVMTSYGLAGNYASQVQIPLYIRRQKKVKGSLIRNGRATLNMYINHTDMRNSRLKAQPLWSITPGSQQILLPPGHRLTGGPLVHA